MKSEFLLAITQLSAEKNLSKEVVLAAVEQALASAYRKDNFAINQNIEVKINPDTGKVEVWAEKVVVEQPADMRREISLEEARLINPDVQMDEAVMVEATPHNAGRIAAQTAKQVILQRLHEAEHSAIIEEYEGKESDIISGVVQRIEPRQVLIDLVRTEAVLPPSEQMPNERYRVGQRLKVVILEVLRTPKGPRVIVSRSHPDIVKRLFEMEIPEVFNGTVEIKSIAREAGHRTKVAVAARQEGIDPVGCCVGLRGIRIQNIVNELSGEKIDVVLWSPDTAVFIASALSPAQIVTVELDNKEGVATVIVPDRQLSLAIGREGQNARLSAKLAGWKIDIKAVSVYEAQKAEAERIKAELAAAAREEKKEEEAQTEIEVEAEVELGVKEEPVAEVAVEIEEQLAGKEEITLEELIELEIPIPDMLEEVIEEEPEPEEEEEEFEPTVFFEAPVFVEKSELRFAEDILGFRAPRGKSDNKNKKKKAGRNKNQNNEDQGMKKVRNQDVTASGDEL